MIKADEARKLFETDEKGHLQPYVERVYGQAIKEAAEGHMTYIIKSERRPYEAVKEIVDYLKEYGYSVVIRKVAYPLWHVEVCW